MKQSSEWGEALGLRSKVVANSIQYRPAWSLLCGQSGLDKGNPLKQNRTQPKVKVYLDFVKQFFNSRAHKVDTGG